MRDFLIVVGFGLVAILIYGGAVVLTETTIARDRKCACECVK
jgi:hypothetical protein